MHKQKAKWDYLFATKFSILLFLVEILAVYVFSVALYEISGFSQTSVDHSQYDKKQIERLQLIRQSVDPRQRTAILQGALAQGTPAELQLIRTEFLKVFDDYQTAILPVLKRDGLYFLLEKFDYNDWKDWPTAAFAREGLPTRARRYVDDIYLVNPELGSYLETAAYLFFRLRKSVDLGVKFDLDKELSMAIGNAEVILKYRKDIATPARYLFYPSILRDRPFLDQLEVLKCKFRSKSIRGDLLEVSDQLENLREMDLNLCSGFIEVIAIDVLNNLSLHGSNKLKESVVFDDKLDRALQDVSGRNSGVAKAYARFLAISSLDAMDRKEIDLAEELLRKSMSVYPGLKSQAMVGAFLSSELGGQDFQVRNIERVPSIKVLTPESKHIVDKEVAERKSDGPSVIFLITLLVMIGVFLGVGVKILQRVQYMKGQIGALHRKPHSVYKKESSWMQDSDTESRKSKVSI